MKKKITVLVCDYCSKETGDVVTRSWTGVDGAVLEAEACKGCWAKKTKPLLGPARATRRKKVPPGRSSS